MQHWEICLWQGEQATPAQIADGWSKLVVYMCTADDRYRVGTYTPALLVSIVSVTTVNMGQV